jgi:hypothetical protein
MLIETGRGPGIIDKRRVLIPIYIKSNQYIRAKA